MPETDVLTIHEHAALLRVGLKTAYALAQSGEVAGVKVGGKWQGYRVVDRQADPTRPEGR